MFLVIGALWFAVGAVWVPLRNLGGAKALLVTKRVDSEYFGRDTEELIASDPVVEKYRTLLAALMGGALLLGGSLVLSVTWFGVRQQHAWSLVVLSIGVTLAVVWWLFALSYYVRAGVRIGIGDAPPFIWVPAVLLVPASVLGWIGLR